MGWGWSLVLYGPNGLGTCCSLDQVSGRHIWEIKRAEGAIQLSLVEYIHYYILLVSQLRSAETLLKLSFDSDISQDTGNNGCEYNMHTLKIALLFPANPQFPAKARLSPHTTTITAQ
jgi:hypothetical protein